MSKVVETSNENNNETKSKQKRSKYQVMHDILTSVRDKEITVEEAASRLSLRQRPRRPYFTSLRNGKASLTGYTNYNISMFPEQWENLKTLLDSDYYKKFIEKHSERVSNNKKSKSNDDSE